MPRRERILVVVHDLQPYSQIQYNKLLALFEIDVSRARVEVRPLGRPVFAFGSMVDNSSDDPTYIPARVVLSE